MESATAAAALPPAEVHSVPTSDGTEVRLTRYKFGTKGPLVLAPGLRQRRARVRDRHRAQELGPVPRRARLRRLAVRLPREPGAAVELHPVHGRRHRDARLAGGGRHGPARDRPGRGAGDRATASAGSRCSWPSAAGCRACAARRSRSLAGHPIPTPGNQARAWARHGDDLQAARRSRASTPTTTRRRWDGKADRDGDEARCRSGTSTTTRSRAASTSSTATSTTTRTSTSRRWSRPCRASSAAATSRSSSTSR